MISQDVLDVFALDTHLPLANVFRNAAPSALAEYHAEAWHDTECAEHERNGFRAICLHRPLPWDSELLGVKALRIHYANAFSGRDGVEAIVNKDRSKVLQCLLRECLASWASDGIALVDARISSQDLFIARAFEAAGFHAVDSLVTLGIESKKVRMGDAGGTPAPRGDSHMRPFQDSDEDALAEISAESFADYTAIQDRFFLEPSIDHARSQHLFREWFGNLAKRARDGASRIIVADIAGKPVGYIALEPVAPFQGQQWWRDSLNAVSSQARGRGVYRALTQAAFEEVRRIGADGLFTKTQVSTMRVINTWLHLGANMLESSTTFHWTA